MAKSNSPSLGTKTGTKTGIQTGMQLSLRPQQAQQPLRSHRSQRPQTRRSQTVGPRASGRKGHGLASLRDRQGLHERIRAERARVEMMLATAPIPDDRRRGDRDTQDQVGEKNPARIARPIGLSNWRSTCCPVCGDDRIVSDEVIHAGTLSMSECLHCDHRWTGRPNARWVDLGTRMNRGGGLRAAATA
jgi:hypothetical protein